MVDIFKFKGVLNGSGTTTIYTVPSGKRAKIVLTPSTTGYGNIASLNTSYLASDFAMGKYSYFIIGDFIINGSSQYNYSCISFNRDGNLGIIATTYPDYPIYESSYVTNSSGARIDRECVVSFPKDHILIAGEQVKNYSSSNSNYTSYNFMVIEEDV